MRDKDAIIGSMLICEMAAYYRAKGSSTKEELERIYAEYGRYLNKVDSLNSRVCPAWTRWTDLRKRTFRKRCKVVVQKREQV